MNDALIGFTGFVGGNLREQRDFQNLYNSRNSAEMAGKSFSDVFCAGVAAAKWWANQHPEEDRTAIARLEGVLETIDAGRFVLISTVDVYPTTQGKDEGFDCRSIGNHAYGAHRLAFEEFCLKRFTRCFIVRLPGLFGAGLKKNVIFDLLNRNCLENINLRSAYQYYCLADLMSDIELQLSAGVRVMNYVTEPLETRMMVSRLFPGLQVGGKEGAEVHYDLHTRHARLKGREGHYLYDADEIMQRLERFVAGYNRK